MSIQTSVSPGQCLKHNRIILPVSLQRMEQVLFHLELVRQRLSLPPVLALIDLLLQSIDLFIPGLLEQKHLDNLFEVLLDHLHSNHVSPNLSTPEPLHSKIVYEPILLQFLQVLLEGFQDIGSGLDEPNTQ